MSLVRRKWFSLVLSIGLVTLLATLVIAKAENEEYDPYFLQWRPVLGHFAKTDLLKDLYKGFFEKSYQIRDSGVKYLRLSDWRRYRPTGEDCLRYLEAFRTKNALSKPFDIIPLDACLHWLHGDTDLDIKEREIDFERFKDVGKGKYNTYKKDQKMFKIYDITLFKKKQVSDDLQAKLQDYLLKLLDVYSKFPTNGCHSLWLETYTDFIENVYLDCAGIEDCVHFDDEKYDKDPYFRLIVESTKQNTLVCYKTIQSKMAPLMYQAYENSGISTKISRVFKAATNKVDKVHASKKWSAEMTRTLQLISGTDPDKPVSISDATKSIWRIKTNHDETIKRFSRDLANYALAVADMKNSASDVDGTKRYGAAMQKLCYPYIHPQSFLAQMGALDLNADELKNTKPFEFYHLIYSLVRLTNHESIYGIKKDQFEQDVLDNKWEPLYLATLACQIISTTFGEIEDDFDTKVFNVHLKPEANDWYGDWPIALMNEKLVKVAGETGSVEHLSPPEVVVVEEKRAEEPEKEHSASSSSSSSHFDLKSRIRKFKFPFPRFFTSFRRPKREVDPIESRPQPSSLASPSKRISGQETSGFNPGPRGSRSAERPDRSSSDNREI